MRGGLPPIVALIPICSDCWRRGDGPEDIAPGRFEFCDRCGEPTTFRVRERFGRSEDVHVPTEEADSE